MKAYRCVDGRIRLFRPELNMARMNETAKRVVLPNFDGAELIKCIKRLVAIDQEWVPHSTASSLYIRPTLIGTEVRRVHAFCVHFLTVISRAAESEPRLELESVGVDRFAWSR